MLARARPLLARFYQSPPLRLAMSSSTCDPALLEATEQFVKKEMSGNDPSHDWAHVDRVRRMALRLARAENIPAERHDVIELAALLHDIRDYKYSGSLKAGEDGAREFLTSLAYDAARTEDVVSIISTIGYKREAAGRVEVPTIEHAVVQDADRLDAIGALGIARTFSFGASRGTPFYDPCKPARLHMTTEEYVARGTDGSTIAHFAEKLFKLKDLMKTETGRSLAQARHQVMLDFVAQFHAECAGDA